FAARPHVGAVALLARFYGTLDHAELRIDLQSAGVYRHRAGLLGRTAAAVDEQDADAAPPQLVGQHQSGRTGSNDQHIGIHARLPLRFVGGAVRWMAGRLVRVQNKKPAVRSRLRTVWIRSGNPTRSET